MKFRKPFLLFAVVIACVVVNVLGDALSSLDHISLIDYHPLLQLSRNGRQNLMFDRRYPITEKPFQLKEDDYGSTNDFIAPSVSPLARVPSGVSRSPGIPPPPPFQAPRRAPALNSPKQQTQSTKFEPIQSSHHSQEFASGAYRYGYSSGLSTKEESRTPDGTVHGSYSYVDPDGRLITNNYVADSSGFRSSLSTNEGEHAPADDHHEAVLSHSGKSSHAPVQATRPAPTQNRDSNTYYETSPPEVPRSSNEAGPLPHSSQDNFGSFVNGDYILNLTPASAHQRMAQLPALPALDSIPLFQNEHGNHNAPPPAVFPSFPTRNLISQETKPAQAAPQHIIVSASDIAVEPHNTKNYYYDDIEPIYDDYIQYDSDNTVQTQAPHHGATLHKNDYLGLPAVPAIKVEDSHPATPPAQNHFDGVYEEVSLPDIDHGNFGHKNHHSEPHHQSRDDHYLEKIHKIAHGELDNDYGILKEKHNPHKARKNNIPRVNEEPSHHGPEVPSGYFALGPPTKPTSYFEQPEENYGNPASEYNQHHPENVHLLPATEKDPYYKVPVSEPTHFPAQEIARQESSYISESEQKYSNPVSLYNQYEPEDVKRLPVEAEPYYEVHQLKSEVKPLPAHPRQDNTLVHNSDQKYKNPAEYHNQFGAKAINRVYETSPYDSFNANVGHGKGHDISNQHYNNLKSEDRYFNVPVLNNEYGQEISLIGVGSEEEETGHHSKEHADKKHEIEVYTVTNQNEKNINEGRLIYGDGHAIKDDGFYYTKIEEYNPSPLESIATPHIGSRVGQYTEETIKPIYVPDDPLAELSKLISSSHSSSDEGPNYEYPEVIGDPYNQNSRTPSEISYKQNVEYYINGIKHDQGSRGYTKQKHHKSDVYGKNHSNKKSQHNHEHGKGKVYSLGKSMSTIPFTFYPKDDYRQAEPSVLEQLARNHVHDGTPIRLSSTGSVSFEQKSSASAALREPDYHPNQVSEPREQFPFIAAIRDPNSSDLNAHANNYRRKIKKVKKIGRRRKVVKQRRRPGYGGSRRTTRTANSDQILPFTSKAKQQHIKDEIDTKKMTEELQRRKRLSSIIEETSGKEHKHSYASSKNGLRQLQDNYIYHSPNSYSYSSFSLGSS